MNVGVSSGGADEAVEVFRLRAAPPQPSLVVWGSLLSHHPFIISLLLLHFSLRLFLRKLSLVVVLCANSEVMSADSC